MPDFKAYHEVTVIRKGQHAIGRSTDTRTDGTEHKVQK